MKRISWKSNITLFIFLGLVLGILFGLVMPAGVMLDFQDILFISNLSVSWDLYYILIS